MEDVQFMVYTKDLVLDPDTISEGRRRTSILKSSRFRFVVKSYPAEITEFRMGVGRKAPDFMCRRFVADNGNEDNAYQTS